MGALMIQVQVIYTALMAGMMLMYTITLGRYFDYILKHKIPGASQNWALFHNIGWPRNVVDNFSRYQLYERASSTRGCSGCSISHAYHSYGNWLCQGGIFCQWCAAIG